MTSSLKGKGTKKGYACIHWWPILQSGAKHPVKYCLLHIGCVSPKRHAEFTDSRFPTNGSHHHSQANQDCYDFLASLGLPSYPSGEAFTFIQLVVGWDSDECLWNQRWFTIYGVCSFMTLLKLPITIKSHRYHPLATEEYCHLWRVVFWFWLHICVVRQKTVPLNTTNDAPGLAFFDSSVFLCGRKQLPANVFPRPFVPKGSASQCSSDWKKIWVIFKLRMKSFNRGTHSAFETWITGCLFQFFKCLHAWSYRQETSLNVSSYIPRVHPFFRGSLSFWWSLILLKLGLPRGPICHVLIWNTNVFNLFLQCFLSDLLSTQRLSGASFSPKKSQGVARCFSSFLPLLFWFKKGSSPLFWKHLQTVMFMNWLKSRSVPVSILSVLLSAWGQTALNEWKRLKEEKAKKRKFISAIFAHVKFTWR